MKTLSKILLGAAIISQFLAPANAGLFKSAGGGLKAFCDVPSPRQTIIYLDQSVIAKKDPDWYRDIQNKIKFLPSERIHFAMINAEDSRIKEIWSVCHPSMSQESYAKAKKAQSMWKKGVDKELKDTQKFYNKYVLNALSAPLATTPLTDKPSYKGNFPAKSLVEAIYYDSSRYNLSNGVTRVILFSDMVENSGLVSPQKLSSPEQSKILARQVAKRFPLDLKNTEFYVYGVGYTHKNSELNRNLETFWSYWLNNSGAQLKSYHAQLNIANSDEMFKPISYTGVMKQLDGSKAAAQLRIGYGVNGNLLNSWFGIRDIRYPITGIYTCKGDKCNIDAKIAFGDEVANMFNAKDALKLNGSRKMLKGTIGAVDDLTRTSDGKAFSMQVVFEQDSKLRF
jgi:hypothetical protein